MRPERFPNQRTSKLSPRGDGPFKVLERINDNAYKIDLPGKFQVSNTFNVTDLASFDAGPTVLRSKPSQEGGNDEDIQAEPDQEEEEANQGALNVPFVPNKPVTRAAARSLHQRFNGVIRRIMEHLEHLERTGEVVGQALTPLDTTLPDKGPLPPQGLKTIQDYTKSSGHLLALKEDSLSHLLPEDEALGRTLQGEDHSSYHKAIEEHLATTFGQLSLQPTPAYKYHQDDLFGSQEAYNQEEKGQDAAFWVRSLFGHFNPKLSPLRQVTLSCLTMDDPT